jgi:hypothetical protein
VQKNRPLLLILVCLALAGLVWLDNRRPGDQRAPAQPAAPAPAEALAEEPAGFDAGAPAADTSAPASEAAAPAADSAAPGSDAGAAPAETNVSAHDAVPLQLDNPLASFDKEQLKDWVERPLFAPSRKRPPAAAAAAQPVPQTAALPAAPSYDLLGIISDGTRALALLQKKGEGSSFRVEVGDMIGGWRVAKIEPAAVVLERNDGTSQTVPLLRR